MVAGDSPKTVMLESQPTEHSYWLVLWVLFFQKGAASQQIYTSVHIYIIYIYDFYIYLRYDFVVLYVYVDILLNIQ